MPHPSTSATPSPDWPVNPDAPDAPVAAALSFNDGAIGLVRTQWSTLWFRDGSEPGVLTLNYYARDTAGRSYAVSVMASNPHTAINDTAAIPELLALARGGFQLAGSHRH